MTVNSKFKEANKMSKIITMNGIDSSEKNNIEAALCLKHIMKTLLRLMKYEPVLSHIASLSNAVFSRNIAYICDETRAIEDKFLSINNAFDTHPLEYLAKLAEKGDSHIEAFRRILHRLIIFDCGNNAVIILDTWLLECPLDTYRSAF